MTEAALRRAVLRQIKKRWPHAYILGGRHSVAGVPDFLVVVPTSACSYPMFIALELKGPHGRVTPLQAATLAKIQRAGGEAYVVRSVDELNAILSR